MENIAIKVNNISKRYRIGLKEQLNDTLVDSVFSFLKSPLTNYSNIKKLSSFDNDSEDDKDIVWALKNIEFEVKSGEIVGLIGGNGAGKSTLLKILSRIVHPTNGSAEIYGKIGSLLEVGTGFHPELTGRENIYLNGTLLGMTKNDVDSKLDNIIEFSGIKKYIDTPVKRYSSGMKVRLAFAVAAHLEPEILLIDEVLAVGDNNFQKKCLGKMDEISKQGRTIIFVSHNMPAILRLCTRVILLENGQITEDGKTNDIVFKYLNHNLKTGNSRFWDINSKIPGNEFVQLISIEAVNENNQLQDNAFDITKKIGIKICFKIIADNYSIIPNLGCFNQQYERLFNAIDTQSGDGYKKIGTYKSTAWIPGNLLSEGKVFIDILLITMTSKTSQRHVHEEKVISFDVLDYGKRKSAKGNFVGEWGGAVRPLLEWKTEYDCKS